MNDLTKAGVLNLDAYSAHLTIICGHYGVGKTNLSLNLARDLRKKTGKLTLIDLDIVNPYFRTTDNIKFTDSFDIGVFGPVHGGTNLDTPSLRPEIDGAIMAADENNSVIIDVGGDADGSRALARFEKTINAKPYVMIYVVNLNRPDAASVEANLTLMQEIEFTSRIKITHVIGNTHLRDLTDAAVVIDAIALTQDIAARAGIECLAVAVPKTVLDAKHSALDGRITALYPLDIIVKPPWE